MPKFSVIVPVYNCEEHLPICVRSIQDQTLLDWELLLVDDGSSDGSGALCNQYAEQDNRIRVFHKTNGGASSARNLGLEQSTGEYVVFADSDDRLVPDYLLYVANKLEESKAQLLILGASYEKYHNGAVVKELLQTCDHSYDSDSNGIRNNFPKWFRQNRLSSVWAKVFRADILQYYGVRFDEELVLYEDLTFVLDYLGHVDFISLDPKIVYHYREEESEKRLIKRCSNLYGSDCLLRHIHKSLESIAGTDSNENREILSIEKDIMTLIVVHALLGSISSYSKFRTLFYKLQKLTEIQRLLSETSPNTGILSALESGDSWRAWLIIIKKRIRLCASHFKNLLICR